MQHALGLMQSAVVFQSRNPQQAADLLEQAVEQLVKARNQLVEQPIGLYPSEPDPVP